MLKRYLIALIALFAIATFTGAGCTSADSTTDVSNGINKNTPAQLEVEDIDVELLVTNDDAVMYELGVVVPEKSTVIDVMNAAVELTAAEDMPFTYESTSYEDLGVVVDTIGDISADADTGYYWTLYLNDEMAIAGASTLTVEDFDSVQWQYETFQ